MKLAVDGTVVSNVEVGDGPPGITFAGGYLWVANNGSNSVSKLEPGAGTLVGTFAVSRGPFGVVFDGTNIWVASMAAGTVSKTSPANSLSTVP
jgi:YVTN family beta-propeller protein